MSKLPLVAVAAALVLAAGAVAAAAKPDAHDRALAGRLSAKVTAFGDIVAQTGESRLINGELKSCAPFESKNPSKEFAAAFALLPALMVRLVDEYKPELTDVVRMMRSMHPDSPVFSRWLTALGKSYSLILEFDNHGQKVDLCKAATVILDKTSTAADYERALGVPAAVVAKLYESTASNTVTELDPKMKAFLIAAGVSARNAKTLTS